jgi:glycosyltransferase involved in cell wall biosynthesis
VDGLVARYATDRIISVSSELRGHLTRYIDPRKVVVIQNGLDIDQVRSNLSCEEAKKRLGIPVNSWVIGTAGRLEPIKRLDCFLQAAKLVSGRIGDARFVIAGEGRERPRLEELAHTLGLEKQVLFLGHRSDIYDVLRALDVFVLCSDHEGLPMVLLEALHLGVPVVGRQVGGLPEVIQDGVNGILVSSDKPADLAQACLRFLEDEGLRQRLTLAAPKVVREKFSAESNAARVAALYEELCGIQRAS